MPTLQIKPKVKRKPAKRIVETDMDGHNRKKEFLEQFTALGKRLEEYRKENGIPEEPFTMEEIVAVVKEVRAERYAKQHNS